MPTVSAVSLIVSKLNRLSTVLSIRFGQLESEVKAEEINLEFMEKTLEILKTTKDLMKKNHETSLMMRRTSNAKVELLDPRYSLGYLGRYEGSSTPQPRKLAHTDRQKISRLSLLLSGKEATDKLKNAMKEQSSRKTPNYASPSKPETAQLVGRIKHNLESMVSRIGNLTREDGPLNVQQKLGQKLKIEIGDQSTDQPIYSFSPYSMVKSTKAKQAYNLPTLNSSPSNPKVKSPRVSSIRSPGKAYFFSVKADRAEIDAEDKSRSFSNIDRAQNKFASIPTGVSPEFIPSKDDTSVNLSDPDSNVPQKEVSKAEKIENQLGKAEYSVRPAKQSARPLITVIGLKEVQAAKGPSSKTKHKKSAKTEQAQFPNFIGLGIKTR